MVAAATGTECLARAEEQAPDLVLLDVGMPDMNGWEVARRLRRTGRERLAIVMLSALAPDKAHQLEHERLHDGYLMKPVHLRQLLEQMHILLDIEWTYDRASDPAPSLPLKSLAAMDVPPVDALARRQSAVQITQVARSAQTVR